MSLHTNASQQPQVQPSIQQDAQAQVITLHLTQHPGWKQANRWKQTLNNLRLVIELSAILNLLEPWLNLFPIPRLAAGLECLVALMNRFLAACHTLIYPKIPTFLLPSGT